MKEINLRAIFTGIFAFFALSLSTIEAAEIGLDRKLLTGLNYSKTIVSVVISGQIQYGDAKKVEDFIAEINRADDGHQIRRLLIHSPGGYAGEAMEIGRLLRANGFEVFIPQGTSCISACVLILAGGKTRTIVGKVGIDYPHFLQPAGPNDDVPALLAEIKLVMRDYFQSMGVSEDIAEGMFSVPKGVVHFLSEEELLQYQLK